MTQTAGAVAAAAARGQKCSNSGVYDYQNVFIIHMKACKLLHKTHMCRHTQTHTRPGTLTINIMARRTNIN